MSHDHDRVAAVHAHSASLRLPASDAESQGHLTAAKVLYDAGHLSNGDDPASRLSMDRFARAVAAVVRHRDVASEEDFSRSAIDVARMTLAAWSFDRMVDKEMLLSVPREHDVFLRNVVPVVTPESGDIGIVADGILLDKEIADLYRTVAISAASAPFIHEDSERSSWERGMLAMHGDDLLGQEPLPSGGLPPLPGEIEDSLMESVIHAGNRRDDVLEHHSHVSEDARMEATGARASFHAPLEVQQKALLAAEAHLAKELGRPLRPNEERMFESALDRVMRTSPGRDDFVPVARTLLLDVSIQMDSSRTMEDGSFGRPSRSGREAFNDVIDASAGMDLHATAIAPMIETTRPMAEGRFSEIPDDRIAGSILDALAEARSTSYSKSIDDALFLQAAVIESSRKRLSDIVENGPDASVRILGKGPRNKEGVDVGIMSASRGAER